MEEENDDALFSLERDRELLALLALLRDSSSKRILARKGHVQEAVDVLVLIVDVGHEGGCFFMFWGGKKREKGESTEIDDERIFRSLFLLRLPVGGSTFFTNMKMAFSGEIFSFYFAVVVW